VADGWCWFVLREKYCWLLAGGWFVVREKYCWLVADKPSEQADGRQFWVISPPPRTFCFYIDHGQTGRDVKQSAAIAWGTLPVLSRGRLSALAFTRLATTKASLFSGFLIRM
jgi:hypothetical protein